MTGREKIEAAFSRDGTPEIPVVICYESIFIRDHWDQLTDCPWWYRSDPDIDHQLAWRRDVFDRTGYDWVVLPSGHSRRDRKRYGIRREDGKVFWIDRTTGGQDELHPPMVSGWSGIGVRHSVHPDHLPMTHEELDESIPPPAAVDAASLREIGCFDLADRVIETFDNALCPTGAVSSPIWSCYSLWGYESMMTMVVDRPDLVAYACERSLQGALPSIREAAQRGAGAIWIEECLSDQISPDAFRTLNLPYLKAIVDEIRSCGMLSVYYYCGDPADRWDLLLEPGADALSLEESKKGFDIDIEEVVSIVDGRCAVLGNLDAIGVLQEGTEDTLRTEIDRQIQAGRRNGSRFIMSIGSPVTPETPVDRVRMYCDIARDLGTIL